MRVTSIFLAQEDNILRKSFLIFTTAVFLLTACNSTEKPNAANFTAAINRYLASHGQICISVGSQFPIDVPVSRQSGQNEAVAKLTALENARLVNATDTTAVIQSLANSLSLSPHKPEPVRRYTVSAEGQKYLQTVMTDFGKTAGFCYGQKQVDSIVKWTEPMTAGASTQTEVTYTYKIANLSPWAARPDIRGAFPDIDTVMRGVSRLPQITGLQLADKGWEIPES